MYDFGFTHVSPIAMTHNGAQGTRKGQAHLFTDNEWIPYDGAKDGFTADPTNPKNWQIEPFHHYADTCAIITPDFEASGSHAWTDHQYDAFAKLVGEVRARHPDVLIGCWGVGVLNASFRIFVTAAGRASPPARWISPVPNNGARSMRIPPPTCTPSSSAATSTSAILRSMRKNTYRNGPVQYSVGQIYA